MDRAPAERRETRQRTLVYEAVASADTHPTAEWVYERVRRKLPSISLGTVYRNLQTLVADGRLKSRVRDRTTRYDADLSAHDHFVCQACGLLLDIAREPATLPVERQLRSQGHLVSDRTLEFNGLCRDCRQSRKEALKS